MNMEQSTALLDRIHKLEGLLAYATAHGDNTEAERIRAELASLVEAL